MTATNLSHQQILEALSPKARAEAGFWGWDAKVEADTLELRIYDVIGHGWYGGVSADSIAERLSEFKDVTKIRVRINSPGGDAFDGVSIMNLLRQHKAEVEVFVDGYAASAATIIAMGADKIHMGTGSMWMVHEPWTCACGNAGDLRSVADFLDKLNDGIVDIYQARTGLNRERLLEMLEAETWMSAKEAVEHGFADDVVEPESAEKPVEERANQRATTMQQVVAALSAFAASSGIKPERRIMTTAKDQTPDVAALEAKATNLEKQNAELTTSNTELRNELREARTEAHNTKAELAKVTTELTETKAKTTELEDRVTKQEVAALVGDKIVASEVDDFVNLAKTNRTLFDSMLAKRESLKLTERKVAPEQKPNEARQEPAADASSEFASLV
jgi:ATP-dependent Clp protease, protease subunit